MELDPRTRLFLGLLAIACVLMTRRIEMLAVEAAVMVGVLLVPACSDTRRTLLRMVLPMTLLVGGISWLTLDALSAVNLSLRLFDLLTVSGLWFRMLPPDDLGNALRALGLPYTFVFMLTASFRYVPLMKRTIRHIMEAQKSRGIDLAPRLRNAPNFIALLMPLLIQSMMLSDTMAMAMESRGFGNNTPTVRTPCRFATIDYVVMILAPAVLVLFPW